MKRYSRYNKRAKGNHRFRRANYRGQPVYTLCRTGEIKLSCGAYGKQSPLEAAVLREFISKIPFGEKDKQTNTQEVGIRYHQIGTFDFQKAAEQQENASTGKSGRAYRPPEIKRCMYHSFTAFQNKTS